MSYRRYKGTTSRGRRDHSSSSSIDDRRRRLDLGRTRRRDMSLQSDSERFRSSRHRRERDGRRPRSARLRRSSLDDSDGIHVPERRRRRSYNDDRRGSSRRYERSSGRRSRREESLKNDIKSIFDLFAEVVEMVNYERKIIERVSGQTSRSSRRLPKLRLDDDQSAYKMLHNLYKDATSINDVVNKRQRKEFFHDLEGDSIKSPRYERRKYRDERRHADDRDYGRRSGRGYRDHGYEDERSDYDRHRSRRNHRGYH